MTTNFGQKGQLSLNQTQTSMVCACCQKHKHKLRARKSKLSGQKMLVCNDCFEKKYEPRWLVIISAQALVGDGPLMPKDEVAIIEDHLSNHRYYGDEIPATDLLR